MNICRSLIACAIVALFTSHASAQDPGLRVVVIEGEDAVNIIQQKTAVRPIVEVRDRNNLPVAGAVVTFSIPGGASSFGGAATLTVATNAAGQAAVTGLTPSVAGAFQIQVSAAFQGQIATATIAQTNVLTAAQAVAAGGAASGGSSAGSAGGAGGGAGGGGAGAGAGAAGGAGGLSTTTLVVAGAAVAGGAAAASQALGGSEPSQAASGPAVYKGLITGPYVMTSQGGNGSCTVNRMLNGTITLTLETNTTTSVSGPLRAEGSDAIVSQTCQAPDENSQFNQGFMVTGTPARFGFDQTINETRQESFGTINKTRRIVFEAALNGSTVTGTLKIDERGTVTGGAGGTVNEVGGGTYSITLTKQ